MKIEARILDEHACIRIHPSKEPSSKSKSALFFHGYSQTRLDLIPIALQISELGFRCLIPDLPGHGTHTLSLSAETLLHFGSEIMEQAKPEMVFGYSLGARLALDLSNQSRVIAVSPPFSSRFDAETRGETLKHLNPRWVREEKPMSGLTSTLEAMNSRMERIGARPASRQLILHAQKDLTSVQEGVSIWNSFLNTEVIRIPHSDHRSILSAPDLFPLLRKWISE